MEWTAAEKEMIEKTKQALAGTASAADDNIKSPPHYKLGDLNIEAIDVIRAVLGDAFPEHCRGNTLKYLIRAGKKDDVLQDLKKARVYLDWEIEAREKITEGE